MIVYSITLNTGSMLKNCDKTDKIISRAYNRERLSEDEYLYLYKNAGLLELGNLANAIRKQFHPDSDPVTFVIDRNINYTNVCSCQCKFCEFYLHKLIKRWSNFKATLSQLNC